MRIWDVVRYCVIALGLSFCVVYPTALRGADLSVHQDDRHSDIVPDGSVTQHLPLDPTHDAVLSLRMWSDVTGKFQRNASFLTYDESQKRVYLKLANGRLNSVRFEHLHQNDQLYVLQILGKSPVANPTSESSAAVTTGTTQLVLNQIQEAPAVDNAPELRAVANAPRYRYHRHGGDFQLVAALGTASYYLHHGFHIELLYQLRTADPHYFHYQEWATQGYRWAFGKTALNEPCGCYYGYPVWYRPPGDNQPWRFFGYLSRQTATHTH